MPIKNLQDAFVHELKELVSAEKQIHQELPKLARRVSNPELKEVFEVHRQDVSEQLQRLEQVFQHMGKSSRAIRCEAVTGMIHECEQIFRENFEPHVKDALLIADVQKVAHFNIASYGTLCTWGELLGWGKPTDLLKQTLSEKKQADERLTQIAQQVVNKEAMAVA